MGTRHEPTAALRKQVEAMSAYGIPVWDIAKVVAIDEKTLRKHYRDELETGHVKANAKVAENLFRKATGDGVGAITAAIFWLRTRAGWKDQTWMAPETEEIGKKEQANRDALTAQKGTAWDHLLN